MLNLNDLHFFAAAVEHGGFSAASRQLGLPKSTISKRVAELENHLDARLIQRTSRSFALTEVGRDFYEHARAALIEAESAEQVVRKRVAEPSGAVRMTASVPTAQWYLSEHLPELARAYPRLHVQLDVSDRFVDLVQEGYDIAVRSHFAPLPDSGLLQRQLMVEQIILVAAPDYLKERDPLASPEALKSHDGLLTGMAARRWLLCGKSGEKVEAAPVPRFTANESMVLLNAAIAGLGITCLPERFCRAALKTQQLTRVLPDWHAGSVTTSILMPHRRGQLPGVRAVVEFLVNRLG